MTVSRRLAEPGIQKVLQEHSSRSPLARKRRVPLPLLLKRRRTGAVCANGAKLSADVRSPSSKATGLQVAAGSTTLYTILPSTGEARDTRSGGTPSNVTSHIDKEISQEAKDALAELAKTDEATDGLLPKDSQSSGDFKKFLLEWETRFYYRNVTIYNCFLSPIYVRMTPILWKIGSGWEVDANVTVMGEGGGFKLSHAYQVFYEQFQTGLWISGHDGVDPGVQVFPLNHEFKWAAFDIFDSYGRQLYQGFPARKRTKVFVR